MRYDLIAFTVVLAALLLAMYYVPPSQLVLLPTVMIMSAVASSVITWGMLRGGSSADIRTTVISSLLGSVGGVLLAQGIAAFAGQPSISAPVPVALLNAFSGAFIGSVITTIMTSGEISGAVSTSTVVAAAVLVAIMFAMALIIVLTGTGPLEAGAGRQGRATACRAAHDSVHILADGQPHDSAHTLKPKSPLFLTKPRGAHYAELQITFGSLRQLMTKVFRRAPRFPPGENLRGQ